MTSTVVIGTKNYSGVLIQNVSTDLITGPNCPFTYELPDGTTTVRIYNPNYVY